MVSMYEGFRASSPNAFRISVMALVSVLSAMNSVAQTRSMISFLVTISPALSARHTKTSITLSSSWILVSPRDTRFNDGSTSHSPTRKAPCMRAIEAYRTAMVLIPTNEERRSFAPHKKGPRWKRGPKSMGKRRNKYWKRSSGLVRAGPASREKNLVVGFSGNLGELDSVTLDRPWHEEPSSEELLMCGHVSFLIQRVSVVTTAKY